MSETGHRVKYIYTLYKEPGHVVVADGIGGFAVERWFEKHDPELLTPQGGWDYLRYKLMKGKVRGYSAVRVMPCGPEKGTKEPEPPRPRHWVPNPVKLCGNCRHWQRRKARDPRDGKLYGVCGMTGETVERCAECRRRRQDGRTDTSGGDPGRDPGRGERVGADPRGAERRGVGMAAELL